jgi:GNAT superfamily N-acetyltransferase
MKIRGATSADARGIALVHVNSSTTAYRGLIPEVFVTPFSVDQSEGRWRRQLDDEGATETLVAEHDGAIVGFVHISFTGDAIGELRTMYVDPDHWSTGVGQALMSRAVESFRAHDCRHVTLWVLESNQRGRRFYERSGWSADGMTKVDEYRGARVFEVRYARSIDGLPSGRVDGSLDETQFFFR